MLISKKTLENTYYINLFIYCLDICEVLQCDNKQKFKDVLLIFLKKHNIKFINGRFCMSQI